MTKSGRVGLAQFILRTSETLSVLKPMKGVLVLSKIRFAEEIRSTEELKIPPVSLVKPEELKTPTIGAVDSTESEKQLQQIKWLLVALIVLMILKNK